MSKRILIFSDIEMEKKNFTTIKVLSFNANIEIKLIIYWS